VVASIDTSDGDAQFGSLSVTGGVQTGEKLIADGGLGVGNSLSASSLGNVVKKIEVFDENGNSLGFVPVYDSIN
jgi:hypothetical protein